MIKTIDHALIAEADIATPTSANIGRLFGNRYLALRVLKHRQHGETLLATDTTCDELVVVKVLAVRSIAPEILQRLERDATLLRDACNDAFAPLRLAGREDESIYLVRLLDLVRSGHNQASLTIDRWKGRWNYDVRRLVENCSYQAEGWL